MDKDLNEAFIEEGDRPLEKSPQGRYIRFDSKLGSGAYKTVYKAYDTDQGIDVAWNAIDIGSLPTGEKSRIIQEVQLLQKLEHKNIINFYGSWFSKEKNQVVFITEIMTSGTLKSYIKRVHFVKWKIIKRWCIQILEGLEYLHSQTPPIIHRDLKCDNIFINGNTGDLRIGDLGLSTQMAVEQRAQSVLGTPEFMAPELYDENYDEKVDIYAFGMCLLEMVTKEVPYSECINPAQIYKKVIKGIRPRGMQRVDYLPARNFIELCLSRGNGEIDVTAAYLLRHDFLSPSSDDDNLVTCLTNIEDEALLEEIQRKNAQEKEMDFSTNLNMESGVYDSMNSNVVSKSVEHSIVGEEEQKQTQQQDEKIQEVDDLKEAPDQSGNTNDILSNSSSSTRSFSVPDLTSAVGNFTKQLDDSQLGESSMNESFSNFSLENNTEPTKHSKVDEGGIEEEQQEEPCITEPLSGEPTRDSLADRILASMPGNESEISDNRINVMNGRANRTPTALSNSHSTKEQEEHAESQQQKSSESECSKQEEVSSLSAASSPQIPVVSPPASLTSPVTPSVPAVPATPAPVPAPSSINSSISSGSSNSVFIRKRGNGHDIKASDDVENEHCILLNMRIMINGKSKEIKFSFNLFTDSAHEVASELAADVGILETDLADITDSISYLVTEGKNRNLNMEQMQEFEIWEEGPEPYSFNMKPLPHVSKLSFQKAVCRQKEDESSYNNNSNNNNSAVSREKEAMEAASLLMQGMNPNASVISSNNSTNSTKVKTSNTNISSTSSSPPTEEMNLLDNIRNSGVANSNSSNFGGVEIDLSTIDDPGLQRQVRDYENRMMNAISSMEISEHSLDRAILHEEEKHQKEIEKFKKKMLEFQIKKQKALLARQRRIEELAQDFKKNFQQEERQLKSNSASSSTSSTINPTKPPTFNSAGSGTSGVVNSSSDTCSNNRSSTVNNSSTPSNLSRPNTIATSGGPNSHKTYGLIPPPPPPPGSNISMNQQYMKSASANSNSISINSTNNSKNSNRGLGSAGSTGTGTGFSQQQRQLYPPSSSNSAPKSSSMQ